MIIFGGCTHDEAYSDVWQLRVVSSQAHWVQLQITGVNRLYAASLCLLYRRLAGCGAIRGCLCSTLAYSVPSFHKDIACCLAFLPLATTCVATDLLWQLTSGCLNRREPRF